MPVTQIGAYPEGVRVFLSRRVVGQPPRPSLYDRAPFEVPMHDRLRFEASLFDRPRFEVPLHDRGGAMP